MSDQSSGAKLEPDSLSAPPGEMHPQSTTAGSDSPDPQIEITPDPQAQLAPRSFATILEGLRTAEDSFYFMADTGPQSGMRFPIEGAETLVGWDELNERITFDPAAIATACAVVRKDWIGVVVQPQSAETILLNQEPLRSAAHLRNGDQLSITPPGASLTEYEPLVLTFHEPASLLVLDSLFPNKLPPPVPIKNESSSEDDERAARDEKLKSGALAGAQNYFGYFTAHELWVMGISTLLLAAIIFFILDNA